MNATYCNKIGCAYKSHNRKCKATCGATGCNARVKFLTACPMHDPNWRVMDEIDMAELRRAKG